MRNRVQAQFSVKEGIPTWAILHYLQQTEINYIKLASLESISLIAKTIDWTKSFSIAAESAPLYSGIEWVGDDFSELIYFDKIVSKGDYFAGPMIDTGPRQRIIGNKGIRAPQSPKDRFWNILSRHDRPVVFKEADGKSSPVYQAFGQDAFVIRKFEVNSPVQINLEGLGSVMSDLYYAGDRERRAKLTWASQQVGKAANNINDIVRASSTIANPDVPDGIRNYANIMLIQLLEKQERLNIELGIKPIGIDQSM